jgi:hypothetical protein
MFWSNVTPNYGLKFTMPQIIKNMGYTSANAQLLTIPCYTVGAIAAYGFLVISDRYKWRMPTIVFRAFSQPHTAELASSGNRALKEDASWIAPHLDGWRARQRTLFAGTTPVP